MNDNIKVGICGCKHRCAPPTTYKTIILKPNCVCGHNTLTQEMLSEKNTKYVIKYDFTLGGERVIVPEGCILEFDGGSLRNGTIVGQDTVFINVGDVDIWGENLTKEGTWREHSGGGGGSEEDRPYDPSQFVGMGKKYIQRNIVDGKNILTQSMISEANTIYVFQYDFDLDGEEIEIPQNCVLEFDGGTVNNGDIKLNDTIIISDNKAFKNIGFKGIVNNSYIHLKWIDHSVEGAFQDFVNLAIRSEKNIDLDGLILDVSQEIIIDKYRDTSWWWLIIKNGTIRISSENLFETPGAASIYSQYVYLKDIEFINTRTEFKPYSYTPLEDYWEDYNTPEDPNNKVCVFSGNHFLRIKVDSCIFQNVSLVDTGGYIQSFYIINCLMHDLRFDFIHADKAYDLHFINNSVERSCKAIVIWLRDMSGVFVIGNLIESVKNGILYHQGLQMTIHGNYFEGCFEGAIKSVNNGGNVPRSTSIIGNFFCPSLERDSQYNYFDNLDVLTPVYVDPEAPEPVIDHYLFYNVDLGAIERDFVIQGNSFQTISSGVTRDGKPIIFKDVMFRLSYCRGLYFGTSIEDMSDVNYYGNFQIPTIHKDMGKDSKSALDNPCCGVHVPYSYRASDFVYESRLPSLHGARRSMMDQIKTDYVNDGNDCLWKSTLIDSTKPYIPWTYVKRQLAEDSKTYTSEYENVVAQIQEYIDAQQEVPAELILERNQLLALIQGPWFKQALIIDSNFGSDYLDANIGKPGSRIEFYKEGEQRDQYPNGVLRFHPSYGIEYWSFDGWSRADGFKEEFVRFGPTTSRPKLEDNPAYTSLTVYAGFCYFDTTLNKPVFFCGYDKTSLGDNGWVDAMGNDPRDTITLTIGSFPANSYTLGYSTKTFTDDPALNGCLINIEEHQGEYCKFTGGTAGMTFLKSEPVLNETADYATGYGTTGYNNADGTVQIPADAKYLWIQTGDRKVDKIDILVRIS